MKKTALFLTTLLLPVTVAASFDADLYFGMRNKAEVRQLQEFLRDQGVYSGPITSGFFQMTRAGVKKFQEREGIKPAAGYFGRLTRARANMFSSIGLKPIESPTAVGIAEKIKALQAEIVALLEKPSPNEQATTSPVSVGNGTSISTSTPATPDVPPPPTNKILVTSSPAGEFPAVEVTPLKIGEFYLHNDTDREVLFADMETILSDEMDSTFNRNRKVYFLLREGTDFWNTLISKTEFTFILTPPKVGEPHRSVLLLPFAVNMKAGEKKTFSLWVDLMKYVRSGTLKIESTKFNATTAVTMGNSVKLILTKEPPL